MGYSYSAALFRGIKVKQEWVEVTEPGCQHGYPGELTDHIFCSLCGKPTQVKTTKPKIDFRSLCHPEDDAPNRLGVTYGGLVYRGYNVVSRENAGNDSILIGDIIEKIEPRDGDDVKLEEATHLSNCSDLNELSKHAEHDGLKVIDYGVFLISIIR